MRIHLKDWFRINVIVIILLQLFLWFGVDSKNRFDSDIITLRWFISLGILIVSTLMMIVTDLDCRRLEILRAKQKEEAEKIKQANLYEI